MFIILSVSTRTNVRILKGKSNMTKAQERTIEAIKSGLPRFDFYGAPADYEVKTFDVEENEYFVSVYIVTGRKNDSGTLAAALCRKYRHAFIGKNGGISYMNSKHNTVRCSLFSFLNEHYTH